MQTDFDRRQRIAAVGFDYDGQPKERIDACDVCGETVFAIIAHVDRYGYNARACTCTACGLTFLNPRMKPGAYVHFYNGIYRPLVSAYHGRLIDAVTVQEDQHEYADAAAHLVAPFLERRPARKLLDVGGSTGIIAAHFAECFGLEATVVDPSADEIEHAGALGIRTVTNFVEEWDAGGEVFDVVGMFQTIDHLLSVRGTLEKLRALVAEDGLLVVDIVDFRAAYLRNWSVAEAVKIDHPFYLTRDVTEFVLARAGFRTLQSSFSADHLHVTYVCRPVTPRPDLPPRPETAAGLLREIRYVQNAPRPSGVI